MLICILCQGRQTRLRGKISTRKQLLEAAGETILGRTFRLCQELAPPKSDILTVAWPDFPMEYRLLWIPEAELGHCILDGIRWLMTYFAHFTSTTMMFLLGDVVFSRAALERIFGAATDPDAYEREMPTSRRFQHESQFFAATPDLGLGSGEVFAFVTQPGCAHETRIALDTVSCRGIPPEVGYQPGHLRNLLWRIMEMRGLRSDSVSPACYHSSLVLKVSDFTDDIDTMADVERLGELGQHILAEERARLT